MRVLFLRVLYHVFDSFTKRLPRLKGTQSEARALLESLEYEDEDNDVWEILEFGRIAYRTGERVVLEDMLKEGVEGVFKCPRCHRAVPRVHLTLFPAVEFSKKFEFVATCPHCSAGRE